MIGPYHAEAIRMIPETKIVAVATSREDTARRFAEKVGVDSWYADYRELLKRDDVQVVNICTPPYWHEEMVLAAAEAGKHVLVEKPIAINLRQADTMVDACQKAGVKMGVIFQYRFSEAAQSIKKAIGESLFGRLFLGDVYVKWFRTGEYYQSASWRGLWAKEGGGALINQSIHAIDLLQWFMGPVEWVEGICQTVRHRIETEDLGLALVRFRSGAVGVIEGSTALYPGFPQKIELHGEKGSVVLEGDQIAFFKLQDTPPPEDLLKKAKALDTSASPTAGFSPEYHRRQIQDFLQAIRENRPPLVDGAEGRKALEIVRAIYLSSESNTRVLFPVQERG
ncbi:MAG: Gfo/Idh/MocA family protein, partial [Candidatus Caldatribacteriaceae bacterium]